MKYIMYIILFGACTIQASPMASAALVNSPQSIAVLGTGYVGLITGTCLAECGHFVTCVDTDTAKIAKLNRGEIPIYEPYLEELIHRNVTLDRLVFTDNPSAAIQQADIIFIAVGTPSTATGEADLSAVFDTIRAISKHLDTYKVICVKSTVPVGTADKLINLLRAQHISDDRYGLVSNPEFLREGSAVDDFFTPDRIVIGTRSEHARTVINMVYEPFITQGIPFVYTDHNSAEMIKYASNTFLATKLSFINEIANLCDATNADIISVSSGMGLDKRIGRAFLNPGPGFGGSCFPKDILALISLSQEHQIPLHTTAAAYQTNEEQKRKPVEKLAQIMKGALSFSTVAILGLAFKANTDDIRCSPAIETIKALKEHNVSIRAYDPAAAQAMRTLFPEVTYCTTAYDAALGADACIVLTEWPEFKHLDLQRLRNGMKGPYLVDMRNILDCTILAHNGFIFDIIGRRALAQTLLNQGTNHRGKHRIESIFT